MDPRRRSYAPDYAAHSKRRASRSPEGALPPNRTRLALGQHHGTTAPNSPSGSSRHSSPSTASLAARQRRPPAPPMAPSAAPHTSSTLSDQLVDLMSRRDEHNDQLMGTSFELWKAKTVFDEASKEYDKSRPCLSDFPAYREQLTAQRSFAEKALDARRHEHAQSKRTQKKLVEEIAEILSQGPEVKPIQSCDKSNAEQAPSAELPRLEAEIKTLQNQVKDREAMLAKQAVARADLDALRAGLQSTQQDYKADSTRLADRLDSQDSRVGSLEKQYLGAAELSNEVAKLGAQVKDAFTDNRRVENASRAWREEVSEWLHNSGAAEHERDEKISEALDQESEAIRGLITNLQSAMATFDKRFATTIQSIKDLTSQLDHKADKDFVVERFNTVEKDRAAPQSLGPDAFSSPTPGATPFAPPRLPNGSGLSAARKGAPPQMNGDLHINGNATQISDTVRRRVDELESKVEIVQEVSNILQTRYNNLTTEVVSQAMLDQLAVIWPHAKRFESAVQDINKRLEHSSADAMRHEKLVAQAVEANAVLREAAEKASYVAQGTHTEVLALRNDLKALVEKVEGLTQEGSAQLNGIEAEVQRIGSRVSKVEAAMEVEAAK